MILSPFVKASRSPAHNTLHFREYFCVKNRVRRENSGAENPLAREFFPPPLALYLRVSASSCLLLSPSCQVMHPSSSPRLPFPPRRVNPPNPPLHLNINAAQNNFCLNFNLSCSVLQSFLVTLQIIPVLFTNII